MVIRAKKQKQCLPAELEVGDCWIGISLADSSGLILAARVGKHTDELINELVASTEGKTACKRWNSDDWGGYSLSIAAGNSALYRQGQDPTIGTDKWHREATDWKMASTAE